MSSNVQILHKFVSILIVTKQIAHTDTLPIPTVTGESVQCCIRGDRFNKASPGLWGQLSPGLCVVTLGFHTGLPRAVEACAISPGL